MSIVVSAPRCTPPMPPVTNTRMPALRYARVNELNTTGGESNTTGGEFNTTGDEFKTGMAHSENEKRVVIPHK